MLTLLSETGREKNMLYSYKEVLKIYGTDYRLKQAIASKKIYRIECGVYSDGRHNFTTYELMLKKYPTAFLVKNSALFHMGFIQEEPELIHLGTARNALRISDKRVKQHFYSNLDRPESRETHIRSYISDNGNEIRMLNWSRIFLDLIRDRANYPRDELIRLLELFRDCKYFAGSDIDEWTLIMRVINDSQLCTIIEDVCQYARERQWEQAFWAEWEE